MLLYNGILGFANEGKDLVLGPERYGTTVDLYLEQFISGRTYSFSGLGLESGAGTMIDPGIAIFDLFGNILFIQNDNAIGIGRDPRFAWSPPLLPGQAGLYYVGVFDQAGWIGDTYTLAINEIVLPTATPGPNPPQENVGNVGDAGNAGNAGGDENLPTPGDSGSIGGITVPPAGAAVAPLPPPSTTPVPSPLPVPNPGTQNRYRVQTGTAANDPLAGGRENDQLLGYAGNDTLNDGEGDDVLFGGSGNNTLIGGKGRDVFALERGAGRSIVRDFQRRQDKLGLTAGIRFRDLEIEQRNNGTLVSWGNDPLMLLIGVRSNQIRRSDFTSLEQ